MVKAKVTPLRNPQNLNKGKSMRSVVTLKGEVYVVDHGQKGANIRPGTKAGDSFCARSEKIGLTPANVASRAAWYCKGDKSMSKRTSVVVPLDMHDLQKVAEAFMRRSIKAPRAIQKVMKRKK